MISSIQLGNIFESNGRTVASGSNTGFDIEALVDGLTEIRRLPAVQLEEQLEENVARQTAFTELSTILSGFQDASSLLSNPVGVNNESDNIFEYRNASIRSNDGANASTYLSVIAAPGAALSDYDITVDALASHSVKTTDTFALENEDTVAVGSGLPFNAGTLTLGPNDVEITIEENDTLAQIITKINASSDASNVRATSIQVSDGNYRLQLKTTETGAANNYDLFAIHEQIGNEIVIEAEDYSYAIDRSGDSFSTVADVTASDGNYVVADPSDGDQYNASIETTAPELGYSVNFAEAGRYYIHVAGQAPNTSSDSLHIGLERNAQSSAQHIAGFGSAGYTYETQSFEIGAPAFIDVAEPGVQNVQVYAREDGLQLDQIILTTDASYVASGAEVSTLTPKNQGIFNIGFAIEEQASDAQLTIDGTTITRSTNNIDDLIEDVSFNINQITPPGTEVTVDVEPDTEVARSAIINFVDRYNDLRVFYAQQTETNSDGTPSDSAILRSNATLRGMMDSIVSELTSTVKGLTEEPNQLADLGITLSDFAGDDETPLTRNILIIDTDRLDTALLGNFEAVRDVFEFDFTSDNNDIQVFSRSNGTTLNEFTLNIDITNGVFEAVHSGGTEALDFSAIPGGGYLIKGPAGSDLDGLELIYGGSTDSTANISFTQGIGDRIFNELDVALDSQEGLIVTELDSITSSDERLTATIARIDEQIERYRDQQLTRFAALEALISSVNTILQSLDANAAARES